MSGKVWELTHDLFGLLGKMNGKPTSNDGAS